MDACMQNERGIKGVNLSVLFLLEANRERVCTFFDLASSEALTLLLIDIELRKCGDSEKVWLYLSRIEERR